MRAAAMSTFLYTLLGLTVGASLHCSVRREISPCTCRVQEPHSNTILVACERMTSFTQVVDALRGKFASDVEISLRIAYSRLDDFTNHTFQELGLAVTNLKLNHDNLRWAQNKVLNSAVRCAPCQAKLRAENIINNMLITHLFSCAFIYLLLNWTKTASGLEHKES